MTFRHSRVRRRLAALLACSLIATIVPRAATAEYGIPAGSGAVVTAGAPLLVRAAPGWDAAVAYEIADGSSVTVGGAEQAAPDGTLWYPVDGGFVPAEAVTSGATMEGGVALYQDAAPVADEWVDPTAASQGWVDPATGAWVDPTAAGQGWVDPATGAWVEPAAAEVTAAAPADGWVDPNAGSQGWVDPTTGEWVDPNAASQGWVDPNTGAWIAQEAAEGWIDPATGAWGDAGSPGEGWVDPNAAGSEGWVDPASGEWVAPAGTGEGWVDPATGAGVAPAPKTEVWTDPAAAGDAPGPVAPGGVEAWGAPIGVATVAGTNGDGVSCRAAPERGTAKLAVLGEGETVEVRGEAVGEWQPVNCAGVGGYVNTAFISWDPVAAPVELEQRRRDRDRDKNGNAGNAGNDGTASASGQQIVDFAMQFEGYPYVYAGEGPYAFDCSGFTKFVIQNVLGMDITHDMFAQYDMGQQVGRDELQPGDLVFFQNTFRPGMSHNGIYIGSGQMVHAENEQTGVKVSDINSDYYSSRWFGAVRFS